jgi:hypothetical protein
VQFLYSLKSVVQCFVELSLFVSRHSLFSSFQSLPLNERRLLYVA